MVLPPNRIGAIRGPGGATLDDVVAALNALSVVVGDSNVILASQQAFLESIAQDMQRLVGPTDPSGWPGLANYLWTMIGNPLFLQVTGLPGLWGLASRNDGDNKLILQFLTDGVPTGTNTPYLRSIRNALSDAGTEPNTTIEALQRLSIVMGLATDPPAGSTIKALLASIDVNQARAADCCEEGGSTDPPDPNNPLNDPPVNFGCPNAIRATSWVNRGTVQVGGSDRYLWQARFDNLPPGIEQFVVAISGATSYGLAAPATKYDLCVSWNFNNNATQPDAIGRNRSNLQNTAATDLATSGVPSPGDFVTGGFVDELSSCDDPDPDNDWCGYIFRTVSSTPPALNVWIASIERTCAA